MLCASVSVETLEVDFGGRIPGEAAGGRGQAPPAFGLGF